MSLPERKGGEDVNVEAAFSLLQEVSFLISHLDVMAFVSTIGSLFVSIIWWIMRIIEKYHANRGLKLDNKIKELDIKIKEKKMSGPKKRPKNKTP